MAPSLADLPREAVVLLPWLPALIGAAFLVLFAARLPGLIERVYWDSDAATAPVIAETFGHGTVILERFGWYTALWFELLTKPLPLHRQIWEVAPVLFALISVALLAWSSWRLAGRWAAAMTATAAIAVSPFVSYDLVTLNYHTGTWVPVVVLAAYLLWLTGRPPLSRLAPSVFLVSVLAGTTLASDHLFGFVGVLPFALTGLLLLRLPRLRVAGVVVVGSAAGAFLVAWITARGMSAAGVKVYAAPQKFAEDSDLWPNFGRMLRQVVQLVNGDYFFDARLGAHSALSFACALLGLAALAAPFVLVRREARSAAPSIALLVYATFWSACVVFNCASLVLSSEGTHPGYYLIPVLYAMAATAPLVLSRTARGRLIAGLAVAVVAIASLVNLAQGRAHHLTATSRPPVAAVANRIVDIANKEDARYGYADYWDASSLTWSKHLAVRVAPVSQCLLPKTDLCKFWFNVNTSWYQPRAGKTFLIRDRESGGVRQEPPESLGPPSATYELSDVITLYVYPYDIASRFS